MEEGLMIYSLFFFNSLLFEFKTLLNICNPCVRFTNLVIMKDYLTLAETAEIFGKSKETLRRWDKEGILNAVREPVSNYRVYRKFDVQTLLGNLFEDVIEDDVSNYVEPQHEYSVLELFAGGGGLAIGLEKAGLKCIALNEMVKWACQTLRKNRPHWHVLEADIKEFDFSEYSGKADVVTSGFPCQAFSYAGKKLGLNDARGTLFYEFARVVQEVKPAICIGENVRGLLQGLYEFLAGTL